MRICKYDFPTCFVDTKYIYFQIMEQFVFDLNGTGTR